MSRYLEGIKIEPRPAIRETIYQYLRHKILSGQIPPGHRLVEAKLAQEVGASRTPIREALHNLEFEKIVTALPKLGYVVREITPDDVREICEIRTVLESLAVRWALRNDQKDLIPKLRANLERLARNIQKKTREEAPKLDADFHDLISQASGSHWLAGLNQKLSEYMLHLRLKAYTHLRLAQRALEGHQRILAALEKKDATAAEEAIAWHMNAASEDIISFTMSNKAGRGPVPGTLPAQK